VPATGWSPLLTGAAADEARTVVREIANALAGPEAGEDPQYDSASLSRGTAGVAMFYAAAAEVLGDEARTTALALCDRTIDAASDQPLDPMLYSGIVGVGWALSVVERRLEEPDDGDSDIDEYVGTVLAVSPWPGSFDLILGVVGLGVYCLERLPRESARRGLDLVVARLGELAETTSQGLAWRTGLRVMPPYRRPEFPDGYFDVGLAHGAAGVVAFLAEATRAGAAGARELLAGAVDWLLAQRLADTSRSVYPGIVAPGQPPAAARVAWCYGDPGVAAALLGAGDALGAGELLEEARALARRCAGQNEFTGIADAGLCHGATGVAHILNRVGQALADERILDNARFWFGEALGMRRAGMAIAGFPSLDRTGEQPQFRPRGGVLEGASGVGLALVSAVTATEPWWDPMLLLWPARGR
jgi:lantibiotic modifying enzyme